MVKEGYKKTEAGVLPLDWHMGFLGKLAIVLRGGSPRPIQNYITDSPEGINWIKIGDVKPGEKYVESTKERIIPEGALRSRTVKKGDFILSNSMSFGRPYILNIDGCIHDGWLVIQDYQKSFDRMYLYYVLCSELTTGQYKSMAAGSSVQNLNKEKVNKVVLPIPEKKEQTAIADTLSDVDELISLLEKLIEKKSNIKIGTMQELLTGRRRLSGFNSEWKEVNLAKNSKLKARIGWQGLTTGEYLESGYSYLITGTDFLDGKIYWDGCNFVSQARYLQDLNIQVINGDVLITKDGTIGKVAIVDGLTKPATLNSGIFVVRPITDEYSSRFLYYVLLSDVFKDFLNKLSAGSTINHLYQKDLVNFKFFAPTTIKEQKEIASLIYDMDVEIIGMKEELDKYRQIKQGMMNELLTGKIRLL